MPTRSSVWRRSPICCSTHDRPIETRTDDSVMRALSVGEARRPLFLRRSRGYVPEHHELPVPAARPLLACGAEQKNTFCLAKGSRAWVSHHIGDLEHFATHQAFREGIAHFEQMFAVAPELVAHDLHPGYLSTTYALERDDLELIGVQHHHAHLAACLAEHGGRGPAVAAIFDGTGYGLDGTVWGGELLVGDLASFERAGHLRPVRMPGGAAAIREPWRMAFAWLRRGPRRAPAAARRPGCRCRAGGVALDVEARGGAGVLPDDDERGAPVRRRRCDLRPAGPGQLRGPGRRRARGGGGPGGGAAPLRNRAGRRADRRSTGRGTRDRRRCRRGSRRKRGRGGIPRRGRRP